MLAKSLIMIAAAIVAWGCSSDSKPTSVSAGGAGSAGSASAGGSAAGGFGAVASGSGELLVFPETLEVAPHASGCGALQLKALTLQQGPQSLELYVALENVGDVPVCSPSFSLNLLDASETQLATSVGGLLVRGFFRLKADPTTTAACVAPGDVTMAAVTDFAPGLALADVQRAEYFCNLWRFDALPAGRLDVNDVMTIRRDGGLAYSGTLVNGLEIPLSAPGVTIFPLNAEGRPLGAVNSRGTSPVPPGSSWDFETDAVSVAGVDFAAYPTPSL
jgi:hypothetical protein